ncbi:MAG: SPOR domain-containing protein [Magnetococcales bacterium]|nr:SPOR domain-containing protein [Magnetococcales bacterium]
MNPRYPTSNQFRRRRTRKLGRPLLLGVLAAATLYFIFSSPSAPKKPKVEPPPVSSPVVNDVVEHKPPVFLPTTTTTPPAKPAEPTPDRRLADIDAPSLTDLINRVEPVGRPAESHEPTQVKPSKDQPSLSSDKSFFSVPASDHSKKPIESTKPVKTPKSDKVVELPKAPDAPAKTTEPLKILHDTAAKPTTSESPPPSEDPPFPSAPKDLAPKQRTPDMDITFYRELPRRKVIVEESTDATPAKTPALATVTTPEKTTSPVVSHGSGPYLVQIAVFKDAQRAAAMASDLQKRAVPARVVKSKDGKFFRIRLGPFPSHDEATKMLRQWKLDGASNMIFQDNEG